MSALAALRNAKSDAEVELQLALALCETCDTPHSLAISMALRARDWSLYKELAPDPRAYMDCKILSGVPAMEPAFKQTRGLMPPDYETFRLDRQISRMLVKSRLQDITQSDERSKTAMALFWEIEKTLADRHGLPLDAPWIVELSLEMNSMLSKEGSQFLTPKVLEDIVRFGRLGPGGTPTVASRQRQSDKLRFPTSTSPQLVKFLPAIKAGLWSMDQPQYTVVNYIEIKTVPKTAWIDRTIASVPVADMFLQLGLAKVIELILRREGVDIRDQTRNQNLASRARELKLATIDLSSASSWFSERNLQDVLPPDLMHLLGLIRPRWCVSEGVAEDQQASLAQPFFNWLPMGCGYTFNLMTLYFWALIKTIVPRHALSLCSVYGDDIIVPQKYAGTLVERLETLGFEVNRGKSYLDGNFFESCGTEWFANHDVLPFYSRMGQPFSAEPDPRNTVGVAIPYRVQLANKLRRWSSFRTVEGVVACDMKWRGIWRTLIDKRSVPRALQPPVPYHLGDVGLLSTLEESNLVLYQEAIDRGYEVGLYNVPTLTKHTLLTPIFKTGEDAFAYLVDSMLHTVGAEVQDGPSPETWRVRPLKILGSRKTVFVNVKQPTFFDISDGSLEFSFGKEALRGCYGKSQTKLVLTEWPDGFGWVSTL